MARREKAPEPQVAENATTGPSEQEMEAMATYSLHLRTVNEVLEDYGAEAGLTDMDVHMTQLGYHCLQLCLKLGSIKTMQLMARVQRDAAIQAKKLQEGEGDE